MFLGLSEFLGLSTADPTHSWDAAVADYFQAMIIYAAVFEIQSHLVAFSWTLWRSYAHSPYAVLVIPSLIKALKSESSAITRKPTLMSPLTEVFFLNALHRKLNFIRDDNHVWIFLYHINLPKNPLSFTSVRLNTMHALICHSEWVYSPALTTGTFFLDGLEFVRI